VPDNVAPEVARRCSCGGPRIWESFLFRPFVVVAALNAKSNLGISGRIGFMDGRCGFGVAVAERARGKKKEPFRRGLALMFQDSPNRAFCCCGQYQTELDRHAPAVRYAGHSAQAPIGARF